MKDLIKLLKPDKIEVFVYFIFGIIILLITSFRSIKYFLDTKADVLPDQYIKENMVVLTKFNEVLGKIDPRIVDFVVWVLVGSLVFIMLSVIIAAIKNADEEIEILHYFKYPKNRRHEIVSYLTKLAVRIAGIFGFVFWLIVCLNVMLPELTKLFVSAATSLQDLSSYLWLIIAAVIAAICLYIFTILLRITTLKPRVFS